MDKTWKPYEKMLLSVFLLCVIFGYYCAFNDGGNLVLFLAVTIFLIILAYVIIQFGFKRGETLTEPLHAEILLNLPYDEAFDKCEKSLTVIHGEVDYVDRARGIIMAIPLGVPVWARGGAHGAPNFINARITFEIKRESKTKTRIKFVHNIREDISYKISKERSYMTKIRKYLQKWEAAGSTKNPGT
jgi:hypothetical protein